MQHQHTPTTLTPEQALMQRINLLSGLMISFRNHHLFALVQFNAGDYPAAEKSMLAALEAMRKLQAEIGK